MNVVVFYHDTQTDHDLVAVHLPFDLMIVLHEDTLAQYEVRAFEPARYKQIEPYWRDEELRIKLLEWSSRINSYVTAGIAAKVGEVRRPMKAVARVQSWTNGSYHRNYKLDWFGEAQEGDTLYVEARK